MTDLFLALYAIQEVDEVTCDKNWKSPKLIY